jgi:5-methylcytosine-specific restriction protein B
MGEQTHASDIRRYAIEHYVAPARAKGKKTVEIPVRAVHDGMGLVNIHPAVCGALRAESFRRDAKLASVTTKGPAVSPTTVFVCEL